MEAACLPAACGHLFWSAVSSPRFGRTLGRSWIGVHGRRSSSDPMSGRLALLVGFSPDRRHSGLSCWEFDGDPDDLQTVGLACRGIDTTAGWVVHAEWGDPTSRLRSATRPRQATVTACCAEPVWSKRAAQQQTAVADHFKGNQLLAYVEWYKASSESNQVLILWGASMIKKGTCLATHGQRLNFECWFWRSTARLIINSLSSEGCLLAHFSRYGH